MLIVAKLIAFLMMAAGVMFLVNPKAMKSYVDFWLQGSRMRKGGLVNLIIGIALLIAAPQCKVPIVITLMGLISLIKGIALFTFGLEKVKAATIKWRDKPHGQVRLFALLPIGLGFLLLWSI